MNEVKTKLLNMAKDNESDLLKLCSDLIKAKSVNPGGDIYSAINVIKDFFDKEKIEYELIDKASKEFPIIIAKLGSGDKKVFLNGHCDVVPIANIEGWDFDPFSGEIKDGKMLGRGTSDMKTGLAGLMFMMKILKNSNAKLDGKIEFHIVSDEETGGTYGTRWLYDNNYFTDDGIACIIAEPTSKNDCEVGQKGNLTFTFKFHGVPAHGSVGNYVGDNAILKCMKFTDKLFILREIKGRFTDKQLPVVEDSKKKAREVFNIEGVDNVIDHVTVNVGVISGGAKSNIVPDYCEMIVDTRLPIGVTIEEVKSKVDDIIKEFKNNGISGIEYEASWNSEGNYTDVDTDLVKAVTSNALEIWKEETVPAYQWASSDARYYRMKGIPTIQYGPANTIGIHSYNETVDVIDIVNSSHVYIGMMVDLLNIKL